MSILNLIYPPVCIHCNGNVALPQAPLCPDCLSILELIAPHTRCPRCFSDEGTACSCHSSPLCHVAAAFEYIGPAASLVRRFKYSNQPFLAKTLASYLVAQFCQLKWVSPDFITAIPMPFDRYIRRGYNQSALLAQECAKMLGIPYMTPIVRLGGDYSQAALDYKQRLQLESKNFIVNEPDKVSGKTLLIIDDVMTTGTTLKQCAHALARHHPSALYGLSLCCA